MVLFWGQKSWELIDCHIGHALKERMGRDEKQNSPNMYRRYYRDSLGEFSNTSYGIHAQGPHSHILMTEGGLSEFLGLKFWPKVIFWGL